MTQVESFSIRDRVEIQQIQPRRLYGKIAGARTLKLCRFTTGTNHERIGLYTEPYIYDLTAADPLVFGDMRRLVQELNRIGQPVTTLIEGAISKTQRLETRNARLLLPVVPSEVWGAGVTYTRSKEARKRETKFGQVYDDVYEGLRPELFLKDANARRCANPGEHICVRGDSAWTVPEPELAVVLDNEAKTLGYTIANDVSARDIEGNNPLYLPQAKTFDGSCSFGPVIVTSDEIRKPEELAIRMRIHRSGKAIFEGEINTGAMRRPIGKLVDFLKRDNILGEFTILMTGTGIVPPDDFSLEGGDMVEIEIEGIGILRNPVKKL